MKKYITVCLALMLLWVLAGCGEKMIKSSELYGFPEPTTEIKVIHSYGTTDEEYILTDNNAIHSILNWFYGLELSEVTGELALVAGNEVYSFYVKDELVFYYDNWGVSAYLNVNGKIYEVENPSAPPYKNK